MAARPSGFLRKSLGRKQGGGWELWGLMNPGPPTALDAMGLGLLLPVLLFWTRGTEGSMLNPNGQHVCTSSRWVLWESDADDG
jgi:hypothetical protein